MPTLFYYLGLRFYFHSNDHEPIHIHVACGEREGKFGIYNILIMEEVQTIVALGAGSITKRVFGDGRIERCDNVKDVGLYIEKIDEMIERKRKLLGME